jgi:hypothetical protein
MRRGTILVLMCCILPLCLGVVSCRKIAGSADSAPLKIEQLKTRDAIPLDYGTLVGVTSNSTSDFAHLWFERADKTILVVTVDFQGRQLGADAVAIPRR